MRKKKKIKSITPPRPQPTGTPATKLPGVVSKHPVLWVAVLLFVLLLVLYHQNIIFGTPFMGGDTLKATKCYSQFVDDALERDIYPLWNPYIFSGMPSFASLSSAPRVNIIDTIFNHTIQIFTDNGFIRIFLNYIIFGVLMFLMLRRFKLSNGAAVFAAAAVIFMPQFVAFSVHGHNTKMLSLMLIPLIIYLVDQLLEKRNLLFLALTALAMGFQLFRAHAQVCFYTYLLIAFYFVSYAIDAYKTEKKISDILKGAGLLVGAGLLAFSLASVIYLSVYEYKQFSIRGGGPQGGLDYDYATGWSFSPLEMLTFFVPGFVGFGGQTYWGPMGWTDYPLYMSIIVLYLAGFAFILKRNRLVWVFAFTAVFSLLVSFGNNFPLLYYPMYKWVPFFNTMRIPSMIHILLDISVLTLAAIGIQGVLDLGQSKDRKMLKNGRKYLSYYTYGFAGFCGLIFLYLIFGKTAYIDLAAGSEKIQRILQTSQYSITQIKRGLIEPAYQLAQTDAMKMIILLLIGAGSIFAFLKKKISEIFLITILTGLVVVDLWWVDFDIINHKFEQNRRARITSVEKHFRETEVVKYLKKQKEREIFRIYPAETQDYNWYMYHQIQSILGYNPAKLKIYQEMLEGFQLNQKMLSMLNTKYIVTNKGSLPGYRIVPGFQNKQPMLLESPYVQPRAFFVNQDTVIMRSVAGAAATDPRKAHRDKIFRFMKSALFNPHETAVLEESAPFKIEMSPENRVKISHYDIHKIELHAEVAKPAHLVLSEIYYPAGWKAYIDGQETKIYKTNYILRSIFLQPGTHKIEFVFNPLMFNLGLWLSIGTFIVLLSVIGLQLVLAGKKLKI